MMNRTFQAKTGFYAWLLAGLASAVAFSSLWYRNPFTAIVSLLLLVILIERIIHTQYTVTADGWLLISKGRFSKMQRIALREITSIDACRSMNIGTKHWLEYLLIHYGKEDVASVMPLDADGFLQCIEKHRKENESEILQS